LKTTKVDEDEIEMEMGAMVKVWVAIGSGRQSF
jgi:hypothetical protein